MFSIDFKDSASIGLSLGLILGVAVVLIKFLLERKDHETAYFVVLIYDLLKVTAVGLVLTVSINLYTLSANFSDSSDIAQLRQTIDQQAGTIVSLTNQLASQTDRTNQLQAELDAGRVSSAQRQFLTEIMSACTGNTLDYQQGTRVVENYVNTLCK